MCKLHRKQHNEGKSKKWLWIILTVAVIVLVGISAYLAGQLSSVKKEASSAKSVESSRIISSSMSSKLSSNVTNNEEVNSENYNTEVQSSSVDVTHNGDAGNGLINTAADTFAGKYHNVHDLANDGYTVTSYLIKHEGMTPKQAHSYIYQNYPFFDNNFLTSGEIQTINAYEASLNSSNTNEE